MRRFGAIPSSEQFTTTIWKTSDETVNNSNTLQDDDALTVALDASTGYWFEFEFWWSTAEAADFLFVQAYTGSVTARYFINEYTFPAGTTMVREEVRTSFANQAPLSAAGGTHGYARTSGIIITNASGNLKLQWAQNTADASDTKVLRGSRLTIMRIP